MELQSDYEKQPQFPFEEIEDPNAEVSFRVERMKLSKDKSELRYNDFLLLRGIRAAAYDYRLENRAALEWVIDQYRVSTDPRSGIVNDPNRPTTTTTSSASSARSLPSRWKLKRSSHPPLAQLRQINADSGKGSV